MIPESGLIVVGCATQLLSSASANACGTKHARQSTSFDGCVGRNVVTDDAGRQNASYTFNEPVRPAGSVRSQLDVHHKIDAPDDDSDGVEQLYPERLLSQQVVRKRRRSATLRVPLQMPSRALLDPASIHGGSGVVRDSHGADLLRGACRTLSVYRAESRRRASSSVLQART